MGYRISMSFRTVLHPTFSSVNPNDLWVLIYAGSGETIRMTRDAEVASEWMREMPEGETKMVLEFKQVRNKLLSKYPPGYTLMSKEQKPSKEALEFQKELKSI